MQRYWLASAVWLQMPCQENAASWSDEDDFEAFKKFKAAQAILSVAAQVLSQCFCCMCQKKKKQLRAQQELDKVIGLCMMVPFCVISWSSYWLLCKAEKAKEDTERQMEEAMVLCIDSSVLLPLEVVPPLQLAMPCQEQRKEKEDQQRLLDQVGGIAIHSDLRYGRNRERKMRHSKPTSRGWRLLQ